MNPIANPCPRMLTYKPPRIALALLATAAALQLMAPTALAWPQLPVSLPGGAAVATIGFLIMLRAWWLFRVREIAICPTASTTALITNDVYRRATRCTSESRSCSWARHWVRAVCSSTWPHWPSSLLLTSSSAPTRKTNSHTRSAMSLSRIATGCVAGYERDDSSLSKSSLWYMSFLF